MDRNGALAAAYDNTHNWLSVTQVAGPSTHHASEPQKHDENGIWQAVFDKTTNTIRVVPIS